MVDGEPHIRGCELDMGTSGETEGVLARSGGWYLAETELITILIKEWRLPTF